jgi:hypothetical protein
MPILVGEKDQSFFDQRIPLTNMTTPIKTKKLPEYQRRIPSAREKMIRAKIRLRMAVAKTMRRVVLLFITRSHFIIQNGQEFIPI